MSKKILFTANLDSFFMKFLIPQLKYFKENGYEVSVASKSQNINIPYCDNKFDVDFARGFNIKQNINSYKQMVDILKNNKYDIISCHTPFGGAITRLAAKKCKLKDTKIVYMAHGFHFYKGAPFLNWLIFYNAEKYLAKYTDSIITINLDDYNIAKEKFKSKIFYVPGVGLDIQKFNFKMNKKEKLDLRKSLNINENDFVMIYIAELTKEKRQLWLIKTVENILKENNNFHLLLAGNDSLNGECQKLVKELNLEDKIHFLGFRKDVPNLLNISDLVVTSSKREGLPVNVMEAMCVGVPVVATACRGNRDLISDNKNGYIVEINDNIEFCKKIMKIYNLKESEKKKIKEYDQKVIQNYLLENVLKEIVKIYEK